MNLQRRWYLWVFVLIPCGCNIWQPPEPTPAELDRGLVVMYSGATNTTTEMVGYYTGLREAGIDQAIEVMPWSAPLQYFFMAVQFLSFEEPWVQNEAKRIVAYQAAYPGRPVTLLGYSGGGAICALVAEAMPEGAAVDRVVMMSPDLSPTYNLGPMLDHVRDGAMAYWSPLDLFARNITRVLGTIDGVFGDAAATDGFATDDPRLTQLKWGPELAVFGNNGDHFDYFLSIDWIKAFVAPWVARNGELHMANGE